MEGHPRPGDDAPELTPLFGADFPVRYFLIEQPVGELAGAMYLGVNEPVLGFIPARPLEEASVWGLRCTIAMRETGGDGTAAFGYWSQAGNGITWEAGPVGTAPNIAAVRELVAKAAAAGS